MQLGVRTLVTVAISTLTILEIKDMSGQLLQEISNWKLEARLEDNDRYFYHHVSFKQLESGDRSYVIGRKGTGKSAIAQYLSRKVSPKTFSRTLTFGHFPFNELYQHSHKSYNAPNQYITLWKYLIYSSAAKLLIKNEAVDGAIRDKLALVYGEDDIKTTLASQISRWTSSAFNFSILGTGAGGTRNRVSEDNVTPWTDRVEILERLLLQHMDDSTYFIVFDELDEDYNRGAYTESEPKYAQLLTSLFKAVLSVRAVFRDHNLRLQPVVFLRDDIYYALQDADKTKWSDLKLDLEWSDVKIKNLLAFRLSRAFSLHSQASPFSHAWSTAFSNGRIQIGNRNVDAFRYISEQTHMRPRDYVKYLQVCAEEAIHLGRAHITPEIVKRSAKAFSNYLRSELEDEIHAILPDIKLILDVFSKERKQILSVAEFSSAYQVAMKPTNKTSENVEKVLQILFHFSVIGNQPRQMNTQFFKYQNSEARFNFKEKIALHKGLFKALQVV